MPVEFHTSIRSTCADPSRPLVEQVPETIRFVRMLAGLGTFARISSQHMWCSYPGVWIEPFPLLARLAPETGNLRLLTSIIKLPIHNPVELAHYVATVDHITEGRLDFGTGLGYREVELEAVGSSRKERVSRFEESLALMRQLWTGEEITFHGRYWNVTDARMGYTPLQKPHPPVFIAAYARGAARRAARVGAALLAAPQATWDGLEDLVRAYDDELSKVGGEPRRGTNRNLCVAPDRATAIEQARVASAKHTAHYRDWRMNEATTVDMVVEEDRDPREYAIVGTPEDCVDTINRQVEKLGLRYMGLGFLNMPQDSLNAKMEYVQYVSEEVLRHVR